MSLPNPGLYRIFAYFLGPEKQPEIFGSTGCFINAEKTAKDIANEGYLAVVTNTVSGDRHEYQPAATSAPA